MKKITVLFALFMMAFTYSAMADKLDEVINANIKAHGGEKVYKDMKSMYSEVELSMMGTSIPLKMWTLTPDKSRMEQSQGGQDVIVVTNGNICWVKVAGQVHDIPAEQITMIKNQNPFIEIIGNNPFINYKSKKTPIVYAGTEVVNGKNCDVVEIKQDSMMSMKWFIDQTTNLEVKYQIVINEPEGAEAEDSEEAASLKETMQPEFYITEWVTADGIKVPKTADMKVQGMSGTMTFKKVEFNKPVDAKLFEKEMPKQSK